MNHINAELAILIYLSIIVITLYIFWKKDWFQLNEKNLFHQKLFWLAVIGPVFSFLYFGSFAWIGKSPVLSEHGYTRFYEISKFPLLLLASSVPLASIINNIHRTIQTESQIEASKIKNMSDLYYAHLKQVCDFMANFPKLSLSTYHSKYDSETKTRNIIKVNKEIFLSQPHTLFKRMFLSSPKTGPVWKINDSFAQKVFSTWVSLQSEMLKYSKIESPSFKDLAETICIIELKIDELVEIFSINEIQRNMSAKIVFENISLITNFTSETQIQNHIDWLYNLIVNLFDIGEYPLPDEITKGYISEYLYYREKIFSSEIFKIKNIIKVEHAVAEVEKSS